MKGSSVRQFKTPVNDLHALYGVRYLQPGESAIVESPDGDLYSYKAYFGAQSVTVEKGDCAFVLSKDQKSAEIKRGPVKFESAHISTVIRGFSSEEKSSGITLGTNLPYVNGCSTRQVFPPERPGDPTLQLLKMPPFTSEQAHHIHSTARIVFVIEGRGYSVVGMRDKMTRTELTPGMLCVLDKMCPHHFETQDESLLVLPVHVWSSVGSLENAHPMYQGTFMINQGHSSEE